jgi:hypothetical protein
MRLVMSSSWRMVMLRQAGCWGSHFPIGSLIDSLPSASSWSMITAVKALVLLPICHSALADTGAPPCVRCSGCAGRAARAWA